MLSEHTARFFGSWKKYFTGFSCRIWTQKSRGKAKRVAHVILAVESELPTIESSEKQQAKLKKMLCRAT